MARDAAMITVFWAFQLMSLAIAYDQAQLDVMRNSIIDLIEEDCRRIAAFVRLGFHDSVGDGGVDGCVDVQKPANAGLECHIGHLKTKFDSLGLPDVSFADYIAVAAVQAVYISTGSCTGSCSQNMFEACPDPTRRPRPVTSGPAVTVRNCATPEVITNNLKFRTGRIDCPNSPNGDNGAEEFPEPRWDWNQVSDYFLRNFQFNQTCTIAILGAHSLGTAKRGFSGFNGPWDGDTNVLSNAFYRNVVNQDWMQSDTAVGGNAGQKYWRQAGTQNGGGPMMFNSDLCINYDMSSAVNNPTTGEVVCPDGNGNNLASACGQSSVSNLASQYVGRRNSDLFLTHFAVCFDNMLDSRDGSLPEVPILP